MPALAQDKRLYLYEMMVHLGIDPAGGILPLLSARYAAASRRCRGCPSKAACRDWLDLAPPRMSFAPPFCVNADLLFELQYDEPGPRRVMC